MSFRRTLPAAILALLSFLPAAFAQKVSYVPLDQPTVLARLRDLKRDNPAREAALKQWFTSLGCTGENLKEQPVAGAQAPNVICVLPGKTASTIVVGAHFDHVERGMGAIDNWTGASLLPSLYQTLRERPRDHTFVFIGFTDEEKRLKGSRAYVQQLSPDEKAKILAMVNFDSLGLGSTEAWGNVAAPGLLQLYGQAAAALKTPPRVLTIPESDADSDSFSRAGIAAITLHAIAGMEQMKLLHSSNDQLQAVDPAAYYGNYRFATLYLLLLDGKTSIDNGPRPRKPLPAGKPQAGSGPGD